ncbi:MAG: ABC transporter permease [Rhodothermales bacterium]
MWKNYFTVALRNMNRRKGYAAINIAGLALGFGVGILFLILGRTLLTYDTFHEDVDDIYQSYLQYGDTWGTFAMWGPLRDAFVDEFPAMQASTRIYTNEQEVHIGEGTNRKRVQEDVNYIDPDFFEVFTFDFVMGDAQTAFSRPDAAILTEETAERFFGTLDPIGQRIELDRQNTLTVTAIVADPPTTSSITFSVLADIEHASRYLRYLGENIGQWNSNFVQTYFRVRPGTDMADLRAQFPAFLNKVQGASYDANNQIRLYPLRDVMDATDNVRTYGVMFLLLAFGILLLAAVNFMNLATARSVERAREVGMRKSLGASRMQVIGQFLSESLIVTFAALLIGLALAQTMVPGFNAVLNGLIEVSLDATDAGLWVWLIGLGVLIAVIAGGYPAFYLSRFRPAEVLRGRLASRPAGVRLRNGLVVLQFALTAFLVVGTIVVDRQVRYIQDESFDFGEEPLLVVPISGYDFETPETGYSRLQALEAALLREPSIASVALASQFPGSGEYWRTAPYYAAEGQRDDDAPRLSEVFMDSTLLATMGMELVEGRLPQSPREAVVTENALETFGWASYEGKQLFNRDEALTVVGVAPDVHFASMYDAIKPAVYRLFDGVFANTPSYNLLAVRASADAAPAVQALSTHWGQLGTQSGLTYLFADQNYAGTYAIERVLSQLITYAAVFAIFISLIGLIGVTSLSVAQRTKEIGVRKVLGASSTGLVMLLSRRFALLVTLSLLIAVPLAYLATQEWLNSFVYRISVGLGTLGIAAFIVLGAALLAVGLQTLRATRMNPVDSLRME